MRISDWSSDVCSSDLFDRKQAATTGKVFAPLLVRSKGWQSGMKNIRDFLLVFEPMSKEHPGSFVLLKANCRGPDSTQHQIGVLTGDRWTDRKSTRLNSSH